MHIFLFYAVDILAGLEIPLAPLSASSRIWDRQVTKYFYLSTDKWFFMLLHNIAIEGQVDIKEGQDTSRFYLSLGQVEMLTNFYRD